MSVLVTENMSGKNNKKQSRLYRNFNKPADTTDRSVYYSDFAALKSFAQSILKDSDIL